MPGFSLHHNISKSLRCYKGETLCKPLFSKTVLQWQLACGPQPPTWRRKRPRQLCRQALKKCRIAVECNL
ncbi:protein of unknown function [Paraburkholderia dioscoreae]|uniref:Uncharacterized protein n=1 Tax=Paraburkholderia dioscoreae TaxID=2604047 RepID=A0A5Q4ZI50_9BURK|nr:protein of unknown function [Paraburkholderia dioscoreae]